MPLLRQCGTSKLLRQCGTSKLLRACPGPVDLCPLPAILVTVSGVNVCDEYVCKNLVLSPMPVLVPKSGGGCYFSGRVGSIDVSWSGEWFTVDLEVNALTGLGPPFQHVRLWAFSVGYVWQSGGAPSPCDFGALCSGTFPFGYGNGLCDGSITLEAP
jgi:hypothetical protein